MKQGEQIGNKGLHYRINPALPDVLNHLDIHPHDFTGLQFYRINPDGKEITNTPILPEEMNDVIDLIREFKKEYSTYFLIISSKNGK